MTIEPTVKHRAHGWLLVLACIFTFFSPLTFIYNVVQSVAMREQLDKIYPAGWQVEWLIIATMHLALVLYGIRCGILLWRLHPSSVSHSKRYLQLNLAFGIGAPLFFWPAPQQEQAFIQVYLGYATSVFWYALYTAIAWLYLKRSRQVQKIDLAGVS